MTEQQADYRTPERRRAVVFSPEEFTLHGCQLVIDVDDRGGVSLRVYTPGRDVEHLLEAYGSQPLAPSAHYAAR